MFFANLRTSGKGKCRKIIDAEEEEAGITCRDHVHVVGNVLSFFFKTHSSHLLHDALLINKKEGEERRSQRHCLNFDLWPLQSASVFRMSLFFLFLLRKEVNHL